MKQFVDDISVNSIIGEGSFVEGNVNSAGFTKIDGDIKGNISSKGRVVISQDARVKGNVRANAVVLGGIVNGDIIARDSVSLTKTAVVLGAIVTKKLIIENGALFSGFCYAVNNHEGFEEAEQNYKNRRIVENVTRR